MRSLRSLRPPAACPIVDSIAGLLSFAHYNVIRYYSQKTVREEIPLDRLAQRIIVCISGVYTKLAEPLRVRRAERWPGGGSGERARRPWRKGGTCPPTPGAKRTPRRATRARGTPATRAPQRNDLNGAGAGSGVDIIISNASGNPIYEQITSQMKNLILDGTLAEGTQLPSIRMLANDLEGERHHHEARLCRPRGPGFVETVPGRQLRRRRQHGAAARRAPQTHRRPDGASGRRSKKPPASRGTTFTTCSTSYWRADYLPWRPQHENARAAVS